MKLVLLCCTIIGVATAVSYEGSKVYKVIPRNERHIDLLKTVYESNEYDFWTKRAAIDRSIDIMVSKDREDRFLDMCTKYGIEHDTFIPDVQKLIESEKDVIVRRSIKDDEIDMQFDQYYNLDQIYSWMDQLAKKYPSIVSVLVAGETFEGRSIKVLKLSFHEDRKAVYIEGGIHAREWISPATTNYVITQLLTSTDETVRSIAESYDWYIVPVLNADGYEYTHTTDRLWRKNRSNYSQECLGTDGNRNWDVFWGVSGTGTNSCDETYGGPSAASEAETKALSKFISSIGSRLEVFLSFHSYGNMMLMPYGHTTQHLDNYDEVLKVGQAAADALGSMYGTKYEVGNTAETIYSHSGGTMDWVKLNIKPTIAFTYELSGNPGGFVLPPEYILRNCEEVFLSFKTIFMQGQNDGLISLFPVEN